MISFSEFLEESNRPVPILRQHKYAKEWGVKNIWHVYNSQTKEETGYNIEKLASNKWKLIDPNQENIQYFPSLAACKSYLRSTIGAFNLEEDYLEEHIIKVGSKWRLVSKKSGKNLGTYDSKEGAEQREREVQYFKHKG